MTAAPDGHAVALWHGLAGYLYVPAGRGPFPAVVWCHGSERDPGAQPALGRYYAAAGYVLLVAHRRGHGLSPGPYELDAIAELARRRASASGDLAGFVVELVVEHHERRLADTLAAIDWLQAHPAVDAARTAVSGVSFGGTQTLLAAEAGACAGAYVAFSPATTSWSVSSVLRERLRRAVRSASAPTFLLQAANDHDLGPSEVLGAELERRGPPNAARVYPAHGACAADGHGAFACEAMDVWGADVLAFLGGVLGPDASA